ncbi:MAG: penicillin-binding protein activator [Calditrichia bacterium]|nr:penicillin-binding protein activator [Calditrichia bacterium]
MKVKLLFILLISAITLPVLAQSFESREKTIFNKGIEFYKSGKFKEAENSFNLVINRLPDSHYITANYLMLAKAQYKLKNYSGAINLTKIFLNEFPTSTYVDDIFSVQGDSYYRLKRYESALDTWLEALDYSQDNRLKKLLKKRIVNTLASYFTVYEVEKIRDQKKSSNGKLSSDMALYIKYFNINPEKGKLVLEKSISQNSRSEFFKDAKALLTNEQISNSASVKIALLLPLSGFNEKIAKEIKDGIDLALEKFNSQNTVKLEILLNDYGEDLSSALITLKRIAADESILGVYGPIENDFAAACAVISEYEKLPIFSPTASGNKLTKLSPYFIQLINRTDTQAEFIAKFAIDSMGIKRFATFAPIENQFVTLVNKFVETCENNGAEVVAQDWYYPGEQDFYQKFMKLKRKGLKLTFSDSLLNENPDYSNIEIDSLYKRYIEEEIEKAEENFTKVDSADIPVTSIQGLFIPIYQEDLQFIAPQIAYSNIQAQVFGNGDWYNFDELKKNKNYIDGIIFTTDGYLNEEDWDFRKFRNDFRTKMQKTPTKYNLIGYDTFSYILQYLNNLKKPINRDEFIELISKRTKYNGIYRNIILDNQNSNSKVQMIKYKYGQFLPLN